MLNCSTYFLFKESTQFKSSFISECFYLKNERNAIAQSKHELSLGKLFNLRQKKSLSGGRISLENTFLKYQEETTAIESGLNNKHLKHFCEIYYLFNIDRF